PAIFSTDSTGKGQGHIYVVPSADQQILADAAAPAKAGDAVVIYCTGLGPVTPPVPAGSAVPTDALRNTTATVTLTIGGVAANVFFRGLPPGLTGLYQIKPVVPGGVAGGNQFPFVISVGGQQSPPVTMAVQ